SIVTTWTLLPEVRRSAAQADGAEIKVPAPGGKRLSLVQWSEYVKYFRTPLLANRLWQFFVFCFGFSLFVGGLPLFLERRLTWNGHPFQAAQVGYVWTFAGFLGIFLQGPALGRLLKRYGEHRLNRVGFAAYVVGFTTLAF